jgi:peptidoglycan/xylan/chitin deacetylase (PgdA/CDA1 family)
MDGSRVVVLCYHSIHPHRQHASATPSLFEDHLEWLVENTRIVRFSDVLDVVGTSEGTKPTVAITFDDGYEDNHSNAFPMLLRHKLPATFFVTTAFADGDPQVVQRFGAMSAAGEGEISGMGWGQIRELRAEGMDIGSHTMTHPNLGRLGQSEATKEIAGSKRYLEDQLGEKVTSIAYPFGLPRRSFSRTTIELTRRAGYERGGAILYRNLRKSDGAWSIPRISIERDSIETLRQKVMGGFDWLGFYQEHAPMWALSALSGTSMLMSLVDKG